MVGGVGLLFGDHEIAGWRAHLLSSRPEPCRPPRWARGGHAQTLIAHLLPSGQAVEGELQRIDLGDGDLLVAEYHPPRGSRVMLYLFHGLSGSSRSDYMCRMTRLGLARGYGILSVNHRGCGAGRWLAAGPYHSGRAEDLAAAIRHGRRLHPNCLHLAVGFSLSGNALLLLAAGIRGSDAPDLAISVNAPIRLEKAAVSLKRGLSRLYDLRFQLKCRRAVSDRVSKGLVPDHFRIPLLGTLHDFDNLYTAPAGGFRDREDYYDSCSAMPHLAKIQVPTLMITSADDPMVDCGDYLAAACSPQVLLHVEPCGGHMGYFNRRATPLGTHRWLDYALDRYIGLSLEALAPAGPLPHGVESRPG